MGPTRDGQGPSFHFPRRKGGSSLSCKVSPRSCPSCSPCCQQFLVSVVLEAGEKQSTAPECPRVCPRAPQCPRQRPREARNFPRARAEPLVLDLVLPLKNSTESTAPRLQLDLQWHHPDLTIPPSDNCPSSKSPPFRRRQRGGTGRRGSRDGIQTIGHARGPDTHLRILWTWGAMEFLVPVPGAIVPSAARRRRADAGPGGLQPLGICWRLLGSWAGSTVAMPRPPSLGRPWVSACFLRPQPTRRPPPAAPPPTHQSVPVPKPSRGRT